MADANPTFQIPKDVIEPIIKAHVLEAVTGALGGHSRILSAAVSQTLSLKVDRDGKPASYGGEAFIDFLISNTIRDAVKAAVQEAMEGHKETVRAAVLKELQKKNSPMVKQLVEGMVSGVFDPKHLRYSLKVSVAGND